MKRKIFVIIMTLLMCLISVVFLPSEIGEDPIESPKTDPNDFKERIPPGL